uniref:Muscle-specific beta 1 integrin binding protein 2 n=1 Tax=Stegastes partitus TaxID=144197 RepID=A0A3B5ASU5_9TELE
LDATMRTIYAWLEKSHGSVHKEEEIHIFIVEGFLLHTHTPLIDVLLQCYFISIPYDEHPTAWPVGWPHLAYVVVTREVLLLNKTVLCKLPAFNQVFAGIQI